MARGNTRLAIDDRYYLRVMPAHQPAAACPHCGGPAEVEEFWSTSPDEPTQQVLKRQVRCTKRTRRKSRWNLSAVDKACPVIVEHLSVKSVVVSEHTEPDVSQELENSSGKLTRGKIPAEVKTMILTLDAEGKTPEEIAAVTNRSPATILRLVTRSYEPSVENPPVTAPPKPSLCLERAIDFLAELPDEALQEIAEIASLIRRQQNLRERLELRLGR